MKFWRRKRPPIRNEAWYTKQLGATHFSNMTDDVTDMLCRRCIPSGIREMKVESHHMGILFNNDMEFHFWNSNRYYAWMSTGKFTDMLENKIIYQYSDGRPSAEAMWVIKKMITAHYGEMVRPVDLTLVYQTLQKYADEHILRDGPIEEETGT